MEKAKKEKGKSVRAVPEGMPTVSPYVVVDQANKLLDFLKKTFGGQATIFSKDDRGRIMHATVRIGDSILMVSDTMDNNPHETCMLYVYVDDVDAVYKKAVAANANSIREPKTEFYGDRSAAVKDEWGNTWWIATHVENVGQEELNKRTKVALKERKEQQLQEAH